ncbi:MAG: nucleotide-binding protein [Alphaproteobacteria bacterium]|nr:nucleotide-binding protein [Alphaproteobacteria bacterium]
MISERFIKNIFSLIKEIPKLKEHGIDSPEVKKWYNRLIVEITLRCGRGYQIKEIEKINFLMPSFNRKVDNEKWDEIEVLLKTYVDSWCDIYENSTTPTSSKTIDISMDQTSDFTNQQQSPNKKIFIVHGHDTALKSEVARFLEKGDLEPIILDEQKNNGKTIIEKFEAHTNQCSYAIILLTKDDIGGENHTSLNKRARQNVIYEMGYFMGKLGRNKVAIIIDEGIEEPSDIKGISYIESKNWKFKLLKELQESNFPINFDKIA